MFTAYIIDMRNEGHLQSISDSDLLRRLSELLTSARNVEAELIAHLAEIDARRLYVLYASSLFSYCMNHLHMSEYEALLRMRVARASRRYPVLLEMLADGRLHLSGIDKLAPHLTDENYEAVLARATHQSKRQIEELIAEISPKPDVPPSIRKLPDRKDKARPEQKEVLGPDQPLSSPSFQDHQEEKQPPVTAPPPAPPTERAKVEPLAPARFKVSFTASAALKNKLEKLRSLMRSSVPDGDLAVLIEQAVTEKIEQLEAKRYGKTKNPKKSLGETDTSAASRTIPAAVRRMVYERDQGRCRFRDATGRRCTETEWLELHHVRPYGRGGDHRPENIELRCRAHNEYAAERDYGKVVVARYRKSTGRVSEPLSAYTCFPTRAEPSNRRGTRASPERAASLATLAFHGEETSSSTSSSEISGLNFWLPGLDSNQQPTD